MKWTSKPETPSPEDGGELRRKLFAWKPRRCNDGTTRWLEYVVKVYRGRMGYLPGMYAPPWLVLAWFPSHYEVPGGIHIHFSGPGFNPSAQSPPPPPPPPADSDPGYPPRKRKR